MKKLLLLCSAVVCLGVALVHAQKETSVAVSTIPSLAATSVRMSSAEIVLSGTNIGSVTVNVEAWGPSGVIARTNLTISRAAVASWYSGGSSESALTTLGVNAFGLTKQ